MRSAAVGPSATAVTQAPATASAVIVGDNALTADQTIALPKPTIFQQAAVFAQQSAALQQARDHADALTEQRALIRAITMLQPVWQPLPLGPYPPATDNTNFPRTGNPSLIVSASSVSADQAKEPALYAQGLADQAAARRPQLSGMFWLGLACLGVGIYVYRKR